VLVYLDSSALVKRGVAEAETSKLDEAVMQWARVGDLATSGIAWVEVSRALRRRREADGPNLVAGAIEYALSGIGECELSPEVLALSRLLEPRGVGSLDAVHLASAILLEAHLFCAYDDRLLAAAEEHGLRTVSPGR
jgi:predicted nucleic acid-binding protein